MRLRFLRTALAAVAAALAVTACGGDGDDDGAAGHPIQRLVAFGDSFSDVGSYGVGSIALIGAQTGGAGRWTVNDTRGGQVWVEQLSQRLNLPPACAAETGLQPNSPALTGAPVTAHPGCTIYAQGGARVASVLAGSSVAMQRLGEVNIGYLAKPVQQQMAAHLAAAGGAYRGDELVVVMAGTNEVVMELALTAPTNPAQALQNVADAGAQLGALVRSEVVARGAQRVLVLNVPNIAGLPYLRDQGEAVATLGDTMTRAFNQQLAAALAGVPQVHLADAYGLTSDMLARPGHYGLSNVSDVACGPNAFSPSPSTNGTALVCNTVNLLPGDRSRYLLADAIHPTPYAHGLIADFALQQMREAGWR